jgi:hypothetical protein
MNVLMKQMSSVMPILALNQRADALISQRPHGFKPIKKYIHGRKCVECLSSYDNYLTHQRDKRIIGNKRVSAMTMKRINALNKMAR